MGHIFFQALVGAAAGLMAWVLMEPQFPQNPYAPDWGAKEIVFILLIGAFVGLAVGAVRGIRQGSRIHAFRQAFLGLILGSIGITLGSSVGSRIKLLLFPSVDFLGNDPLLVQMMARFAVIAPLGLFLGAGIGAGGWTIKRVLVGGIGGFFGGAVAGLMFDPVSEVVGPFVLSMRGGVSIEQNGLSAIQGEIGGTARAITAILLGGFVALFIGLVERVTRSAWVRLVLGRNEGREWNVDAPQTYLGRSETAHIPLFGDPNVAPMHACIVKQGGAYILMDSGSPLGTGLNGQRISQAPLFDGAQIQIGSHTLLFMMKQGSAPARAAEVLRAQAYYPGGVAQPHAAPAGAPYGQPSAAYLPPPSMPTQSGPPVSMPTQVVSPTPTAGTPTLVATSGPLAGQRFPILGHLEAGREASGISLGFDAASSRRHAAFAPAAGGVQVTDLGSTNGTFVNGQRVQNATLRPGDEVRIGGTTFRLE